MAHYTMVDNSELCPGNERILKIYYGLADQFVDKYSSKQSVTITVPRNATKWEGHAAVETLRLDLQGTHNGYANIQAQFGTGHENCGKGGSYGGVMMCCDVPFSRDELKEALKRSFESKAPALCQMDADRNEEVVENVAHSKGKKTKFGKDPWTPGTTYT